MLLAHLREIAWKVLAQLKYYKQANSTYITYLVL